MPLPKRVLGRNGLDLLPTSIGARRAEARWRHPRSLSVHRAIRVSVEAGIAAGARSGQLEYIVRANALQVDLRRWTSPPTPRVLRGSTNRRS
jgi:hypothetical protein